MSAMIWAPFPDDAAARTVAGILLEEELIACANLLGPIESIFEWNGKRMIATEAGVLFKTDAAILELAVTRLEDLHPYDTPAILGWRVDVPGQATQDWLSRLTGRAS